ncbi:hypothetical protein AORI_5353 [Amycolatopsis keratiniphila]|uniref:Uncharacterized protein n=1 Tax=Amycolatopsis keratiniphila TaxID=129921 RepID=R4T6E3_9PSEU|nr:hypothetical protein AORI_5353 [Amycolatopsis keratiniphila]
MVRMLQDVDVELDKNRATIAGHVIEAVDRIDLRSKLVAALYDHLHTGGNSNETEPPGFSAELAATVPHKFTRVHGRVWSVENAGEAVVEIDGVRVRIHDTNIASSEIGEVISIDIGCTRPNLSPGFFLADGSLGHGLSSRGDTLRLYAHLVEPITATAIWHSILILLERLQVPYRAKISLYLPRRDALVLYLGRHAWRALPKIIEALSDSPGLGTPVSTYANRLTDGVAMAWNPDDARPGYRDLSFGEHRSLAIVDALLASGTRKKELKDSFALGNIDPSGIFRNATSPHL